MKELKVHLEFIEDALGTSSANPDIHSEFIASKAPDAETREEEIEAIGLVEAVEKAKTIFPRMSKDDPTPFFWDYQVRGFFKEASSALKPVPKTVSSTIKANKKAVDNRIFVFPRKIPVDLHGQEMSECQRPLRAQTAQGERVSLACSDVIPAGSTMDFTVKCLIDSDIEAVKEWLNYGQFKGLGQWRNSGKGAFIVTYEEVGGTAADDDEDKDVKPAKKSTKVSRTLEKQSKIKKEADTASSKPISSLKLSAKVSKILKEANINNVKDLLEYSMDELTDIANVTISSCMEIVNAIHGAGLKFREE